MIGKLRYEEHQRRSSKLTHASAQVLIEKAMMSVTHVVYVMETVKVCGGVKIILQHAERLTQQGIKVTLVAHFPKPTWFAVAAEYIQVPFGIELAHGIPECDVIIANYYKHIQSCIETGIAPVIYFEQGDFHLFNYEQLDIETQKFVYQQYQLPKYILTVTDQAASYIKKNYNRDAKVIPIAIDQTVFNIEAKAYSNSKPYILMMGLEESFKCIEDIIQAVEYLKTSLDMDLLWITPEPPLNFQKYKGKVKEIFVSPLQSKIASLYRGAALFVSASQYESFSLPVLEAMACGCPVVTTENAGVMEYAIDQENVLLTKINDPIDIAQKIEIALGNNKLLDHLRNQSFSTVDKFSWKKTLEQLINYYSSCSSHEVVLGSSFDEWIIMISPEDLVIQQDYDRLCRFILNSQADIIDLPHVYEWIEGHKIVRWKTVAIRKFKNNSIIEKVWIYAHGNDFVPNDYRTAYDLYTNKSFLEAFNLFIEKFKDEDAAEKKVVYAKWMILCLIELEQDREVVKFIKDLLEIYKDYTDLYYLLNMVHYFNNKSSMTECVEYVSYLGDAVNYEEFFYDIQELIRHHS